MRETQSEDTLNVIKFDNCGTNTGVDNGCAVCLERELGKPFMWCPCMLHVLERAMAEFIDKLGMVSNMSIITIFGHKHFKQKISKSLIFSIWNLIANFEAMLLQK